MAEAKKPTRSQLDKAKVLLADQLKGRNDITAVDIGYRRKDGVRTEDLCVRIHVKKKVARTELATADVFPTSIEGVPVDVIEGNYRISKTTLPQQHQKRFDTILGGISVAHKAVSAGTIAAVVVDRQTNRPAILSNWHVLVGPLGRPGDEILQPGRADDGHLGIDTVAHLGRSILNTHGDAAVGILNGSRRWLPFIYGTFKHPTAVRDSVLGETLVKSGRTTAQSHGVVDGEGAYRVEYEVAPQQFEVRSIDGFMLVSRMPDNPTNEEISSGGDSGSLWCDERNGDAVGLHFAGEVSEDRRDEFAIACNMSSVTRELNVRLATAEDLPEVSGETQSEVSPIASGNKDVELELEHANINRAAVDAVLYAYERGRTTSALADGAGSPESALEFLLTPAQWDPRIKGRLARALGKSSSSLRFNSPHGFQDTLVLAASINRQFADLGIAFSNFELDGKPKIGDLHRLIKSKL